MEHEGAFRQALPSIGLSIEKGTAAVADDGQFHVVLKGAVVFSSAQRARAMDRYLALRDELAPTVTATKDVKAALQRQVTYYELEAFRAEASRSKRRKALRKGGKGRSGGVAG